MGAIANNSVLLRQLQQYRQQQRVLQRRQSVSPFVVGVYANRDTRTPTRKFVSASGGSYYTQKIASTKPQLAPPVIIRGVVGRVGIYDQR